MNESFRKYPKKKGQERHLNLDDIVSSPSVVAPKNADVEDAPLVPPPEDIPTQAAPTPTPPSYEPYPPELRTPKEKLLFASEQTENITHTTPFPTSEAGVDTIFPVREEHLHEEPSTRTVEDLARDVDALEKKLSLAQAKAALSKNVTSKDTDLPWQKNPAPSPKPQTDSAEHADLPWNKTEDIDAQHEKLEKRLAERNKRADRDYQKDAAMLAASAVTVDTSPSTTSTPVETAVAPSAAAAPKKEKLKYPPAWKLEPMEKPAHTPEPPTKKRTAGKGDPNDPSTWELEPLQKPSEEKGDPKNPETWKLEPIQKVVVAPEEETAPSESPLSSPEATDSLEGVPAKETPAPASPEINPPQEIPTHELAKDVEDGFAKHFSLDRTALEETPGFQNLNEAQQRLVLERFSSLVRENIHAKAVKGHLETVDTIGRSSATTRFGKLKRAVRKGWHTTTRSYQIGKEEAELHKKWSGAEGGKHTEKLRLLAELSQSVRESGAFGIDSQGRVNFTENEGSLKNASELLNELIRTKPSMGEMGAQERLVKLNETIALGINSMRMSLPENMSLEDEREFEKMAADWALRARKEVVLGTFLEKNRSLEEALQGNEAARGFARSTLLERGGLMATGLVGRGVLGTLCGFIAAPIVGAGIGGFMGWRRKGIEQGDTDLLARMGEKIPTTDTSSQTSDTSPAYLQVLRKGVAERLEAAKKKKDNASEIRVLSRRLAEYDTQLNTRTSSAVATAPSESAFGFDNGNVLNEKLLRLSKEYAQASEELRTLSQGDVDLDLLEAKRVQTEKLADRLAARTDYTQKRLMQQRVDIGGTPAARAGMLANLAAALGTAETTLSMNDKAQQIKIQAHLNDVSAVLAGRDKNVDKARLRDKKKAALNGAALGAGFTVAGAVLADVLNVNIKAPRIKLELPDSLETNETFNQFRNAIADIRGTNSFKYDDAVPDAAAFEALIDKDSTSPVDTLPIVSPPVTHIEAAPTQPPTPKPFVGGSGGFQKTPQEWRGEGAPVEPHNPFSERLKAMETALRQEPVPRPEKYNIPNWKADYHSPRVPRHFPEAWARGAEVGGGGHRADVASFFRAPTAPNPATLETLITIPHETPADAQRVMDFYQRAVEGKSSAFAQHIRDEYTLKARLALKYPELTADIARMHPPVDDATMQSLVKMSKGAFLNGKSNPFMYAQGGVADTPQSPQALVRMSSELDRMRVTFHRDASGNITSYDVNR